MQSEILWLEQEHLQNVNHLNSFPTTRRVSLIAVWRFFNPHVSGKWIQTQEAKQLQITGAGRPWRRWCFSWRASHYESGLVVLPCDICILHNLLFSIIMTFWSQTLSDPKGHRWNWGFPCSVLCLLFDEMVLTDQRASLMSCLHVNAMQITRWSSEIFPVPPEAF